MTWEIQVKVNEKLYLRNPELSKLGKNILSVGAKMIDEMGLEAFTFKKLANALGTNESSIYRYFESKHRLLLYFFEWYWRWMDYQLGFHTQNVEDAEKKIEIVIKVLTLKQQNMIVPGEEIDKEVLHRIVVKEASKTYLTNNVKEDNEKQFFKPYKDFNSKLAEIIKTYSPNYKYARSLSSTLIEMSHYQNFFMHHLPSLTDFGSTKDENEMLNFLMDLALSSKKVI
ncbi:MAG: TetR/AcrR family transcriptional regulator [Flammeovirgaceae bacterium]